MGFVDLIRDTGEAQGCLMELGSPGTPPTHLFFSQVCPASWHPLSEPLGTEPSTPTPQFQPPNPTLPNSTSKEAPTRRWARFWGSSKWRGESEGRWAGLGVGVT